MDDCHLGKPGAVHTAMKQGMKEILLVQQSDIYHLVGTALRNFRVKKQLGSIQGTTKNVP
jgi:hypothetical protein